MPKQKPIPTLDLERAIARKYQFAHIAGLDEAGRGALAGPVVAAAVILPLDDAAALATLDFVTDSKLMTLKQRERAFDLIQTHALGWGIGATSAAQIDEHGILPATKMAMWAALTALFVQPDYLLIDGRIRLASVPTRQQAVVRGDQKSLSIAAASVLAKVSRDRTLIKYDAHFPAYGFAQHKGYGTSKHLAAIRTEGACDQHRLSFAPMRERLGDF